MGRRTGSSPLARGTHVETASALSRERFIPAGAGNTPSLKPNTITESVHPRWRGEHNNRTGRNVGSLGSSPLARGTLACPSPCIPCRRFIPAGAGNTTVKGCSSSANTVHPRWRGEHRRPSRKPSRLAGSSPLARGTPRRNSRPDSRIRFIPAGAGNTQESSRLPRSVPVHPRWRGEHTPRIHALGPVHRFIPAGAGNTSANGIANVPEPVHPRWRGEHTGTLTAGDVICGSSPLARGTLAMTNHTEARIRFIPAGAGNTSQPATAHYLHPVHPRWRGEHSGPVFQDGDEARFIPAGAGNTGMCVAKSPSLPVHPRWRGEHPCWARLSGSSLGSSPLARGTLSAANNVDRVIRFIPAGAGNTISGATGSGKTTVHPRWRGEHTKSPPIF